MQKIGRIGGIGPESTISYYRQIVHGVKAKVGETVSPSLAAAGAQCAALTGNVGPVDTFLSRLVPAGVTP